MRKGLTFDGRLIFDSQLKVVNLAHPPVPQLPLLLHPAGVPVALLLQLEQAIFNYILGDRRTIDTVKTKFLN